MILLFAELASLASMLLVLNWAVLLLLLLLLSGVGCRPEGQGKLESMFSPYDAEDIEFCTECKPAV
jgi:hypothetical protein